MSTLSSKEHYDLMEQFERQFKGERLDREGKSYWPGGNIYQDGHANKLFLAFRRGAAYGACVERDKHDSPLPTVKESLTPDARTAGVRPVEVPSLTDEQIDAITFKHPMIEVDQFRNPKLDRAVLRALVREAIAAALGVQENGK